LRSGAMRRAQSRPSRSATNAPCVLAWRAFRRRRARSPWTVTADGPRARTEVPQLPPRGDEGLPQGREVPDGQVPRRAPLVPAGRARPRADQAERVPAAAAREAEGAAV